MREFMGTRVFVGSAVDVPQHCVSAIQEAAILFVDTETTGLSPFRDRIALIQIHERISNTTLLIQSHFTEAWLMDLFANKNIVFVAHNCTAFDTLFLAKIYGEIVFELQWFDTLIAESLISTSGRRNVSMSLRDSVRRRAGIVINKDIAHGHWNSTVLSEEQIRYAVQDVLAVVELYDAQIQKVAEQRCEKALEIEMYVAPVLSRMTWNGLPMPFDAFSAYAAKQQAAAEEAKITLRKHLGDINFNSTQQVLHALREINVALQSTQHDVLVDFVSNAEGVQREVIQALLDYRAPTKRASMYSIDWYMEHVTDGVVHPLFWSIGADTLRMSSSKPNLQQVPKDARGIFGGKTGYSIVSVDYSQLEIRVAAALCKDDALLRILQNDDVHTAIAAQIFNCEPEEVTKEQRRTSKAASFTLLFGGSARTLFDYARRSGAELTLAQSEEVFRKFFAAFKGLANARNKAFQAAKDNSRIVVKLPGGARRVLFGDKLKPQVILNTTVQGTAAIGLKHALAEARRRALHTFLVAAVHDELVAIVPDAYAHIYAEELAEAMRVGMLSVIDGDIKTSTTIGKTWS